MTANIMEPNSKSKYVTLLQKRKEKYVPTYGQNVLALPPKAGMEYTCVWLMSEKLHKYWPTFSRLSYIQLVSLDEHNFQRTIKTVNSDERHFSAGAITRFLRLTHALRGRTIRLKELIAKDTSDELLTELKFILKTPLGPFAEPNGLKLLDMIVQAFYKIASTAKKNQNSKWTRDFFLPLLKMFLQHPSVPQSHLKSARELLQTMNPK